MNLDRGSPCHEQIPEHLFQVLLGSRCERGLARLESDLPRAAADDLTDGLGRLELGLRCLGYRSTSSRDRIDIGSVQDLAHGIIGRDEVRILSHYNIAEHLVGRGKQVGRSWSEAE